MVLGFLIGNQGGFTAISYGFSLEFYWIEWDLVGFCLDFGWIYRELVGFSFGI
jgi:hypothetical protein